MTPDEPVGLADATVPEVLVRPHGFVGDEPVLRRIGDRDLYLGNVYAASPDHHDLAFEHVLSATSDERPLTTPTTR